MNFLVQKFERKVINYWPNNQLSNGKQFFFVIWTLLILRNKWKTSLSFYFNFFLSVQLNMNKIQIVNLSNLRSKFMKALCLEGNSSFRVVTFFGVWNVWFHSEIGSTKFEFCIFQYFENLLFEKKSKQHIIAEEMWPGDKSEKLHHFQPPI